MLKQPFRRIRDLLLREESKLDLKKEAVKNAIERSGIEWKNLEEILFWDKPVFSFLSYMVFVILFWKFITYELQRFALIILLLTGLCVLSEIRSLISQALTDRSFILVKPENKCLGFELNDVIKVTAEGWLLTESHYVYLMQLKENKDPTICFYLALYIGIIGTVFRFVPLAEILFILGTFLYFYPVMNYLGVIEKLFERFERLVQPIATHWVHTETKRTRNRVRNIKSRAIHSDTEEEEFFPSEGPMRTSTAARRKEIPSHENVDSDSNDEFALRGNIYKTVDEMHSSDYDEDSFLPTTNHRSVHDGFPSLSQFDSLMEPVQDEFHAGLHFDSVAAMSVSDFGVPDHLRNPGANAAGNDTDDDLDLINAEDFPEDEIDAETKVAMIVTNRNNAGSYGYHENLQETPTQQQHKKEPLPTEKTSDQDFELLDKTELHDITDEQINEQNTGQQGGSGQNLIKGVSSMLGY